MIEIYNDEGGMVTRHIRGDGNGGLWISKPFALISLIITLIMIMSSIVFGYAQMSLKVDAININQELIKENAMDIRKLELTTQSCADKVESMQDDVNEMKSDIKELLKR